MRTIAACSFALLAWLAACGSDDESGFDEDASTSSSGGGGGSSSGGLPGDSDGGRRDGGGGQPLTTDVHALVTTDNAFSFGYGDGSGLNVFVRGKGSGGGAIFDCPVGYGPHSYLVPGSSAPSSAYLYIIAWADESTTQGTLAQFKRAGGAPILSGDPKWEICAVGEAYDYTGEGPDQNAVNAKVADCNAGAASIASRGWVNTEGALTAGAIGKLARGEANDSDEGDFPLVCRDGDGGTWEDGGVTDAGTAGMAADAHWMWYDPLDDQSPFVGNTGNRTKTFLIFRLPASALPPPTVN